MKKEQNVPNQRIAAKDLNIGDVFSFDTKHDTVMCKVTEVESYVTSFSEVFVSYDTLGKNKRSGGMTFTDKQEVFLIGDL